MNVLLSRRKQFIVVSQRKNWKQPSHFLVDINAVVYFKYSVEKLKRKKWCILNSFLLDWEWRVCLKIMNFTGHCINSFKKKCQDI